MRAELGYFALFPGLAALVGVIAFATRDPSAGETAAMLGLAGLILAGWLAWLVHIDPRTRRVFREPLADVPREPTRNLVLRGILPIGGLLPALIMLVTDTWLSDPGIRALLAGLVLGMAAGIAAMFAFALRAERRAGAPLLYARRGWRENLWVDQRPLMLGVVYLVDEPDPERWGEHSV